MKPKQKLQVAVFSSGFGSNLEALIRAEKRGALKADIALVVCDKPESYTLVRANRHKKQVFLIEPKYFRDRRTYEEAIVKILKKKKIDLVVLAGFMRILTPYFTKAFRGRILNVHPAILPSFKGAHAIRDAYNYGAKIAGVTVHFVTDDLDSGPVILQEAVPVNSKDSLERVEQKIHQIEHRIYPKAVKLFAQKKLRVRGRRVHILS